MNQKNRDLPAYPIKFNDQFGQLIILGGMTKLELVAIELLKGRMSELSFCDDKNYSLTLIKEAYQMAEIFCNYQEEKTEQPSKIIS